MTIVSDYGYILFGNRVMAKESRKMGAGEFKAKCLKIMDEVQTTREPLVITKHGKPIVSIVPYVEKRELPWGCMKGSVKITGDIVGPTGERWNADA